MIQAMEIKNYINIPGENYTISALSDGKTMEEAELKMYGEVVETRPTDFWTGEEVKGDFIISSEVVGALEKLKKCKKLHVRLNSIGGEVNAAILIYNRLRELARNGTEIDCTVDGVAMSAGSMIMCAADHISVSAASLVMIHKAQVMLFGWYNADALRHLADINDRYDESIVAAYKRKTGLDEKTLLGMMSETTYMTGKETAEKGFADEVFESEEKVEVAACADRSALMVNGRRMPLYGMPCPENLPVITEQTLDNNKSNDNGGNDLMAKDLRELMEENPELAAKVQEELTAKLTAEITAKANKNVTAQIEAERKRLAEIDEVAFKVDAETLNAAKYGEKACSAGEMLYRAALKDKENGEAFLTAAKSDSEQSGVAKIASAVEPQNGGAQDEKERGLAFMDAVLGKEK